MKRWVDRPKSVFLRHGKPFSAPVGYPDNTARLVRVRIGLPEGCRPPHFLVFFDGLIWEWRPGVLERLEVGNSCVGSPLVVWLDGSADQYRPDQQVESVGMLIGWCCFLAGLDPLRDGMIRWAWCREPVMRVLSSLTDRIRVIAVRAMRNLRWRYPAGVWRYVRYAETICRFREPGGGRQSDEAGRS